MMGRDDQKAAAMEQDGVPAPVSVKKLWRMVRSVYLVVEKGLGKHQPKLAALGVHLRHLLSKRPHHHDGGGLVAAAREHPAVAYLSALSCRSMDPAAAVVHPYPRGAHGSRRGRAPLSSLSCRSMDAVDDAVYPYRPREIEFSCRSTRRQKRRQRAQYRRGVHPEQHGLPEHSSAATVTRLFELMDVREATDDQDSDYDGGQLEILTPRAAPPAVVGTPAPRQVRITDSPFLAREEEEEVEGAAVVDRRADEFITWFHEQLRMQQQQ